VKTAYREALLLYHPDKALSTRNRNEFAENTTRVVYQSNLEDKAQPLSMDSIQKAYATLSNPVLRAAFDLRLVRDNATSKGSQRPAEIVSFEEFVPEDGSEAYVYLCRCGSVYRITEEQLEAEVHLLGCQGCSEVVWVGYEVLEDG